MQKILPLRVKPSQWFLFKVLKSHYCQIVFLISFGLSYFLIPQRVFTGFYLYLAILYMSLFGLIMACIVRLLKERILLARKTQKSFLGILFSALGLISLQVCGIGAPVCGFSLGQTILFTIFPKVFVHFLTQYALPILLFSIIMQLYFLFSLKCFQK